MLVVWLILRSGAALWVARYLPIDLVGRDGGGVNLGSAQQALSQVYLCVWNF